MPAPSLWKITFSVAVQRLRFQLLDAEAATGIHLTESYAMTPASSVSGRYFANPAAHYFGVGACSRLCNRGMWWMATEYDVTETLIAEARAMIGF